MPQEVHTFLDECKKQSKELVSEIEKFKRSSEMNQAVIQSLSSIAQSLKAVIKEVEPFTQLRFRRFQLLFYIWSGVNSVFLILVLILLLLK